MTALSSEKESERKESLLETVDDLIFHLNNARMIFVVLSLSSLILAPIAIVVALFFILHPRFLRFFLAVEPFVGLSFMVYVILTVVMSAVWLIVGWREYRFLSQWNARFKRFISLKEKVDRELSG